MLSQLTIRDAESPEQLEAVRALFLSYQDAIGIDLGYQGFAEEIERLPGQYAPPGGALLLASDAQGRALGCIAMRRIDHERCEMKRLFVALAARGANLGEWLVLALLDRAKASSYRQMLLDTLPSMNAAIALYRRLGFRPGEAYGKAALEEALFFVRDLA
ncbi:GNAT family N-acetyltransferase [Sphingomonas sp. G124]|uniref:GNAT family N-acetyltransferase n=1 Tax=Sphingomonas cremea TaxID=2904799 RepID=A0A9X1TXC9_9SPHN|nr:GNAT family N-acetyltransferase [Sphingomonas cremea]MCF2514013.1 GNAT family N-acetyltransferase [Sphingomonas cremea]